MAGVNEAQALEAAGITSPKRPLAELIPSKLNLADRYEKGTAPVCAGVPHSEWAEEERQKARELARQADLQQELGVKRFTFDWGAGKVKPQRPSEIKRQLLSARRGVHARRPIARPAAHRPGTRRTSSRSGAARGDPSDSSEGDGDPPSPATRLRRRLDQADKGEGPQRLRHELAEVLERCLTGTSLRRRASSSLA
jgi:hypothetical protein